VNGLVLPATAMMWVGLSVSPASQRHAEDQPVSRIQRQLPATRSSNQQPAPSGVVVTDTFWSQALGIRKRLLVWLPPSYASQPGRRFPVAYYLHGAWGDETNWTTQGRLDAMLDSLVAAGMPEMIVVMPDGDDGFYTTWNSLGDYAACRRASPPARRDGESVDTYCVPWPHYDDYIARDLVAFVDRSYRSLAERRHRGIAGLSMGGFGAVTLALAYPDVFAAAASHSGVLAPSRGTARAPVPTDRFDPQSIRASYGDGFWVGLATIFGKDSVAWAARDPGRLAARLLSRTKDLMPALRVDCGVDDPFLVQSRAFRDAALALAIPLNYAEHPGSHTWDYWRRQAAGSAEWLARQLSVP